MNDVLVGELAPPVTVAIGGKTLSLVYDLQAVILYKQKTGDNLFCEGTFEKVNPQEDPERFVQCLWAGLQRKHSDVTIEWLGENISFGPLVNELVKSITEAVTAHFPKRKAASPNVVAPAELPAKDQDLTDLMSTQESPSCEVLPVSISA